MELDQSTLLVIAVRLDSPLSAGLKVPACTVTGYMHFRLIMYEAYGAFDGSGKIILDPGMCPEGPIGNPSLQKRIAKRRMPAQGGLTW